MNKAGFVDAVQAAAGYGTRAEAERSVEAVLDTITKSLSRGEEVAISGFGIFLVQKRAARMGRNPKTGESIQIAASVKPKFRPGKLLKEAVA
ncbi:MAG: HU family DNA-binding protein [Patescibacteria group bacterium]